LVVVFSFIYIYYTWETIRN